MLFSDLDVYGQPLLGLQQGELGRHVEIAKDEVDLRNFEAARSKVFGDKGHRGVDAGLVDEPEENGHGDVEEVPQAHQRLPITDLKGRILMGCLKRLFKSNLEPRSHLMSVEQHDRKDEWDEKARLLMRDQ